MQQGGCFLLSSCERVAAEEAVQTLYFAGSVVRLVERFDRRRDGEFFAGLLARDEFSERGSHVGFVEHALQLKSGNSCLRTRKGDVRMRQRVFS